VDWRRELELVHLPRHRAMLLSRARMRLLYALPSRLKRLLYRGNRYFCPVCASRLRAFMRFGLLPREWCPVCASMRRHRLLWVFLAERTDLFDRSTKRLLHFAPEAALERRLKRTPGLDYVTADLNDPGVMDRQDITCMSYEEDAFDGIVCSHVLEHVPDDRAAMRELARVLQPGGWAALMVPYYDTGPTDEDAAVVDPADRERRFGQHDHVRYYGRDIVDRLEEAGLQVEKVTGSQILTADQLERLQVDASEIIFFCRKPARP
jgi:SAM-dependent methyltransferase